MGWIGSFKIWPWLPLAGFVFKSKPKSKTFLSVNCCSKYRGRLFFKSQNFFPEGICWVNSMRNSENINNFYKVHIFTIHLSLIPINFWVYYGLIEIQTKFIIEYLSILWLCFQRISWILKCFCCTTYDFDGALKSSNPRTLEKFYSVQTFMTKKPASVKSRLKKKTIVYMFSIYVFYFTCSVQWMSCKNSELCQQL